MTNLKPIELEFVKLLSSGKSADDLAKMYKCQRKTILRMVLTIRKKCKLEDTAQLVVAYINNKEKFTTGEKTCSQ